MENAICFDTIKITDDVMFGTVFQDVDNCKELLERILKIQLEELTIVESEKSLKMGISSKGIRIDVYARDIEGNSYDIEMQLVNTGELGLRSRYYHSEMDRYQIRSGQKYRHLKESVVIFVCGFDLFQENRSIYTFESICKENPNIVLKDKRKTVFVNINGNRDGIDEKTVDLLEYFKTGNPKDEFTKHLQKQVIEYREDDEWRENFMTLEMKMDLMMDLKYEEGEIKGKIDSILELLSDYSSDIEKYKDALQEMCKDNENSEKNLNILLKKAARIENIAEFDEALEMLK